MKLKSLIFAGLVALLGLTPIASAQSPKAIVEAVLVDEYDVPAAGYTYVTFADQNITSPAQPLKGALGPGVIKNVRVKTVGSSTTVTAVTAGTGPFDNLAAGDLLIFPQVKIGTDTNTVGEREVVIASVTSDDEVVVSAAIDLSSPATGFTFRFKKRYSDTAADRMFFDVSDFNTLSFQADVEAINATSLDFIVECRLRKFGRAYTEAGWTKNFTAAGQARVDIAVHQDQCRVGWKFNTDTGVQDVAVHFAGTILR